MPALHSAPASLADAWAVAFEQSTGLRWADLAGTRSGKPNWASDEFPDIARTSPTDDDDPCAELRMRKSLSQRTVLHTLRSLALPNRKIASLSADGFLAAFTRLARVDLCGNVIARVPPRSFPATITELNLALNRLTEIPDLTSLPILLHVNLGYNAIETVRVTGALPQSVLSLDLSGTALRDLTATLEALAAGLPKLRILGLLESPLSLVAAYRGLTTRTLATLAELDGLTVTDADRAAPVSDSPPPSATDAAFKLYFGTLTGLPDISPADLAPPAVPDSDAAAAAVPPDEVVYTLTLWDRATDPTPVLLPPPPPVVKGKPAAAAAAAAPVVPPGRKTVSVPFRAVIEWSVTASREVRDAVADPLTLTCYRQVMRSVPKPLAPGTTAAAATGSPTRAAPTAPSPTKKPGKSDVPVLEYTRTLVGPRETVFAVDLDFAALLTGENAVMYTPAVPLQLPPPPPPPSADPTAPAPAGPATACAWIDVGLFLDRAPFPGATAAAPWPFASVSAESVAADLARDRQPAGDAPAAPVSSPGPSPAKKK
ncbi:hypothetical protein H9P43_006964 [Blastocladiella emersonii ATCC 22665]|nr:hypothetical protein H9P43_006964 [Blastocladiella emersonii ATCC 22665]